MKEVKKDTLKRKKKGNRYRGILVSLFLMMCLLIGTGMKQTRNNTLLLALRMALCEEQGKLVCANLSTVERRIYEEELQSYGSTSPLNDTPWQQLIADSVNDLIDGEVALSEEELKEYAKVLTCRISDDLQHIEVSAYMEQMPASDNQYIYLFALEMYHVLDDSAEPIAFTIKDTEVTVFMDWDVDKEREYLFDSYVLAIRKDGKYLPISDKHFITNPEIIAGNQMQALKAESIKGLLLDPAMLLSEDLESLDCKQIVYNIPIANLLGESSDERFPTVYYTYHNITYALDGYVVAGYDGMFRYLRSKGAVITAIVLNNRVEGYEYLIHPLARENVTAPYYEFNTVETKGCETIEAIASFLGERYGDESHGLVSNWIIGNEINQREQWNYIAYMGIDDYVKTYENSFRIFYQAIKSHNANANVYFSIDQMWNSNDGTETSFYNGKDILDAFQINIADHGDIDWGLALHPYSYPLNKVDCWTDEADYTENAPIVSMKNVQVATDYMLRPEFRNADGEVRSIVLSEVGFTSTAGEEIQAAAFAYSYYMAEQNEYIDAFLVNRMTDSEEELVQGLALGLQTLDGEHKKMWDVFAHIDEADASEYTDFALDIIGEDKWEDVLRKA